MFECWNGALFVRGNGLLQPLLQMCVESAIRHLKLIVPLSVREVHYPVKIPNFGYFYLNTKLLIITSFRRRRMSGGNRHLFSCLSRALHHAVATAADAHSRGGRHTANLSYVSAALDFWAASEYCAASFLTALSHDICLESFQIKLIYKLNSSFSSAINKNCVNR